MTAIPPRTLSSLAEVSLPRALSWRVLGSAEAMPQALHRRALRSLTRLVLPQSVTPAPETPQASRQRPRHTALKAAPPPHHPCRVTEVAA